VIGRNGYSKRRTEGLIGGNMNRPYKARFRKGEWTPVAVAGESVDGRMVSREFLQRVVSNYNPDENGIRAKIKIGHSKPFQSEAKAYGYFSKVRLSPANPDIMEAKPEWVHEELIDKLEKGEYRDISPEFRPLVKRTGEVNDEGEPLLTYDYYFAGVAVLGASHPAFPILSTELGVGHTIDDLPLPELTYTVKQIVIQQNDGKDNNQEGQVEISSIQDMMDIDQLVKEYSRLKDDYSMIEQEHNALIKQYSTMIKGLKDEMTEMKDEVRKKHIIEFCRQAVIDGKLEASELMREKPSDTIEESGLVKHMIGLNPEQLNFEMKQISSRERKQTYQQIVNPDDRENLTFDEGYEPEEKRFLEFCYDKEYDLNNISDVDRAYREWRNYVKH
jgi:hypothetical protein